MYYDDHGFSLLEIILAFLAILLLGCLGWHVYRNEYPPTTAPISSSTTHTIIGTSGLMTIHGVISEGPIAPICSSNTPCTKALSDYTVNFINDRGQIAVTTKTDANGSYSVSLPQGTYSVQVSPVVGLPGEHNTISVNSATSEYNISIDTGIR